MYSREAFARQRMEERQVERRAGAALAVASVGLGVAQLVFLRWADAHLERPLKIGIALPVFLAYLAVVGGLLWRYERRNDRKRAAERLKQRASAPYKRQGAPMPPTLANGKICYLEMPAVEIRRSADFYAKVFGWRIRQRGDGRLAFDDAAGEVSGTWVTGRKASSEPGLLPYIMVDSVAATLDAVVANGGELVQPIGADAPEVTARFRDPGGNVIGLYQDPGRPNPSTKQDSPATRNG